MLVASYHVVLAKSSRNEIVRSLHSVQLPSQQQTHLSWESQKLVTGVVGHQRRGNRGQNHVPDDASTVIIVMNAALDEAPAIDVANIRLVVLRSKARGNGDAVQRQCVNLPSDRRISAGAHSPRHSSANAPGSAASQTHKCFA